MDFEARFVLFQHLFRESFKEGFDAPAFRQDHFYAAQILEKAILKGSPQLQAVALPIEARLSISMDVTLPNPGVLTQQPRPLPVESVLLQGFEMDTINLESVDPDPTMPATARFTTLEETSVAPPVPAAPAWQEREATPLSSRQIFLLSQLRIEYRKAFGSYFDAVEFSRNDLYARSILKVCDESGNTFLTMLTREFLTDDDSRPIRRKGSADFEFTLH